MAAPFALVFSATNNVPPSLLLLNSGQIGKMSLHFYFCPFQGIVCGCSGCNTIIDPPSEKPTARLLRRHCKDKHPDLELDAAAEMKKLEEGASALAQVVVSTPYDERKGVYDLYLATADKIMCSQCNRFYNDWKEHSWGTSTAHKIHKSVPKVSFSLVACRPTKFFLQHQRTLIEYTMKLSYFFERHRQKAEADFLNAGGANVAGAANASVARRNQVVTLQLRQRLPTHPRSVTRTGQREAVTAEQNRDFLAKAAPAGVSFLPRNSSSLARVADGQQKEDVLETLLKSNHFDSVGVYEREHLAPRSGDHTKLLDFEKAIGLRDVVVKKFDGSYPAFMRFAHVFTSKADATWEVGIVSAFGEFYHVANEQVGSISPEVRCLLMAIGDGGTERLLDYIRSQYSEHIVSALIDDDDEDERVKKVFLKEELEKLHRNVADKLASKSGYGAGGRTHLQSNTQGTLDSYRPVGAAFVLFFARLLDQAGPNAGANAQYWDTVGRQTLEVYGTMIDQIGALEEEPDDTAQSELAEALERAKTVVMKLLIMALETEVSTADDYGYQLTGDLPTTSMFVLCRTVNLPKKFTAGLDDMLDGSEDDIDVGEEDGAFIIRPSSPGRAQRSVAALLHILRVSFAAAMVHASQKNDRELQKVLWSASVFSKSKPIRDLAYRGKEARFYGQQIQTGTARAHPLSNENDGGVYAWKISTEEREVTVSKAQITTGIHTLVGEVELEMKQFFKALGAGTVSERRKEIFTRHTLPFDDPIFVSQLTTAMFGRPVYFTSDGSRISFDTTVGVPTANNPNKRQSVEVYATTLGCDFALADGRMISSASLVEALVEVLALGDESAAVRKLLDTVSWQILVRILGLTKTSTRGQPRNQDLNGMHCGFTNAYQSHNLSDFFATSVGEEVLKDLLMGKFPSIKFSGGTARQHPFLLFPEMIGRLVVIFLSVFRMLQVRYIEQLEDLSKVDFGKAAQDSTLEECKTLLLNAITKLTMDIQIEGENGSIVSKPAHNWDSDVQSVIERAFGQVEGSLPAPILRMMWASVVACELKNVVLIPRHEGAFDGFNHSSATHKLRYIQTDSHGGHNRTVNELAEEGWLLDALFATKLGIAGYDFDPAKMSMNLDSKPLNSNPLPGPSDKLVLFDQNETVGLLRLGSNIGAESREIQPRIVQEVVTGFRDAMFTIRCGGGKTIAVYGVAIYECAKKLAKLPVDKQEGALQRVLHQRLSPPLALVQAHSILADVHVQELLHMAANDPRPAREGVSLVIVPTTVLADSMVDDLNRMHLIRSIRWNQRNHDDLASRMEEKSIINTFEVIVVVSAFAVSHRNLNIISDLCKDALLAQIVFDEAHCVLLDKYRSDLGKFRYVTRWNVPIYTLSGTLHSRLEPQLRYALSFSLGSESEACEKLKENVIAPTAMSRARRELLTKTWLECKGCIRTSYTVPEHVSHHVLDIGHLPRIESSSL